MRTLRLSRAPWQAAAAALAAAACALCGPAPSPVVPESWTSPTFAEADIDSLAFWPGRHWVLATCKGSHEILVFDAATGRLVSRHGGPGDGPGEFRRPNGLAVVGDLLLVVERDNHRVQALDLPGLEPRGSFGQDILRRPYGIAVCSVPGGPVRVYVTDNYMREDGGIPPDGELGERVKCFRLDDLEGEARLEHQFSFGDTSGRGRLRKVESIAVDADLGRVLVAEEDARYRHIAVYSLFGRFSGRVIGGGTFKVEPEGLALYEGPAGDVWLATDQHKTRTVFHLFGRAGLLHLGSFKAGTTANTDGICVTATPFPGHPKGAAFAVHDDSAVSALPWERILGLVPRTR